MVSVSDPLERTVHALLDQLRQAVCLTNAPGDLAGLISFHFLRNSRWRDLIDWRVVVSPNEWVAQLEAGPGEVPQLAVAGCLLYEQTRNRMELAEGVLRLFGEGLDRLRERQSIFVTPNSWVLQPVNVLGIALGVSVVDDASLTSWLNRTFRDGLQHSRLPLWLRLCYEYGLHLLGHPTANLIPTLSLSDPNDCTVPELALSIWLAKQGVFVPQQEVATWLDKVEPTLLERCLTEDIRTVRDEKAAIVLEVLSSYIHARTVLPKLDLVITVLSSFESAMERWKADWQIADEYDVQLLLWLILRSYFVDVRYEEYLPKRGRSGHRYDIGIPQLGLIVEAKFIRERSDFQKIVEAIGKDSAQITSQASFREILVFVYDPTCSVEQYAWVKKEIENTRLVTRCIIVSAPSTTRVSPDLKVKKIGKRKATAGQVASRSRSSRRV